jgi:hypothetical protein
MKTAIETLLEDMKEHTINVDFPKTFEVLCKYALEMEKDMIEHAFLSGLNEGLQNKTEHKKATEYYNEKYKK